MRILQVSPCWYPSICGFVPQIYNISKNLIDAGHDVQILVPNTRKLDKKGLKFHTLPKIVDILGMNPIVYRLKSSLKKLQDDFDVILIHSYIYEMNSRVALYRKLGILKIPVVLYVRGGLDPAMNPYIGWKVRLFKEIYDPTFGNVCFKYSDHIISVSKQDIDLISKRFNINPNKISYIPNGVDTKLFGRKEHEGFKVIFIGRLVKWKGICFFEDIIKSLPKAVDFLIVGDGPLRDIVKSLSIKYKNVKWMGNTPHNKVIELLSMSDIFVLPTFTEGSPNSCLEASAAGIPSIVFSVGDIPNTLPDNCGFKIKPFNINDFCNKLNCLVDNESLRKDMGKNARKFVEENLNYKKINNELILTLNKVILRG